MTNVFTTLPLLRQITASPNPLFSEKTMTVSLHHMLCGVVMTMIMMKLMMTVMVVALEVMLYLRSVQPQILTTLHLNQVRDTVACRNY